MIRGTDPIKLWGGDGELGGGLGPLRGDLWSSKGIRGPLGVMGTFGVLGIFKGGFGVP